MPQLFDWILFPISSTNSIDIGDDQHLSFFLKSRNNDEAFFLRMHSLMSCVFLPQMYDVEKPVKMVDGWNAWYFDDMKKMVKIHN